MLRKIVFFILLIGIVHTALETQRNLKFVLIQKVDNDKVIIVATAVAIYILCFLFKEGSVDHFVAPAVCRGGAYMHQGNSPEARMCQKLAETAEGRGEIAAYNCPGGFEGMPLGQFKYSANTNSDWKSMYDCANE